ncbi:hypothetical protein [Limimonas halophila]|nr:hypothetical protein [Limimonas halophila]
MEQSQGLFLQTPEQQTFAEHVGRLRELAAELNAVAPQQAEACRTAADVLESLCEGVVPVPQQHDA